MAYDMVPDGSNHQSFCGISGPDKISFVFNRFEWMGKWRLIANLTP